MKIFKNPDEKKFRIGNFETKKRPKSPSAKRMEYMKKSSNNEDKKTRCIYIDPEDKKQCREKLGLYPEFCETHTILINNLYIAPSQIQKAGYGLYSGSYGFKKGDIIGKYSYKWNEVKLGTFKKRCKEDECWRYLFCESGNTKHTKCWDGLDIKSTLMRYINDAHLSNFRNNSYFEIIKDEGYVVASRNISPNREIFVSYGKNYWKS